MLEDGAIALGDSLALLPWNLRVDLDVEHHYSTSVLIHPRQREGVESWRYVIKNLSLIAQHEGEIQGDVDRHHRIKALVCRPRYSSEDKI